MSLLQEDANKKQYSQEIPELTSYFVIEIEGETKYD